MKVLIVSYRFPPANAVGAIRVGNEVRVITPRMPASGIGAAADAPGLRVLRTPWRNVNWLPERLSGGRAQVTTHGYGEADGIKAAARHLWLNAVDIPDVAVGWIPYARRAARGLAEHWRPDVVFGSFWPGSSLLAAGRVARDLAVPWVADYRDLWTGNPYSPLSGPRQRIDAILERRAMRDVAAITTVSDPLARELERLHGVPATVVMNGFDPEDLPGQLPRDPDGRLTLRHMGTIYEGRRDPSALFAALRDAPALRARVRVQFFGRNLANLRRLVEEYEVHDCVEIREPVDRVESLRLQAAADVLLLLTWDDPQDAGTLPGKLFEYLGIRRPILQVGADRGLSADLIRAGGFGEVATTPTQVRTALDGWQRQLDRSGSVEPPTGVARPFTRARQVAVLRDLLADVAHAK